MDTRKALFAIFLSTNILMDTIIRVILPITVGASGFELWPRVDLILHFFGGINAFFLFVILFRFAPVQALLGATFWQLGWETAEMFGDTLLKQPAYMLDHFFIDGLRDTLLSTLGVLFAWYLLSRTREKYKGLKSHPRAVRFFTVHLFLALPLVPVGLFLLFKTGNSYDLLAAWWLLLAVIPAFFLSRKKLFKSFPL